MGNCIRFLAALSVLALLTSCASQRLDSIFVADSSLHAVWPPPPETPRIKLLRIISGPEDIVPPSTTVQRFFEYVTGEKRSGSFFVTPGGLTADGNGVVYIADTFGKGVHKFDLVNREASFFSTAGSDAFASPVAVSLDSAGTLYVVDSVLCKVYRLSSSGESLGELAKDQQLFQRPTGIAIAADGMKYVVDALAQKVLIFNKADLFLRAFPIGNDKEQLIRPTNATVDLDGLIYVTDAFDFSVKIFRSDGTFVRRIGEIGDAPGFFARPKGVATDSDRHLYVVDANFDNFQIFDSLGQTLLYVGKTGNGPGEFIMPNGIFVDKKDRIYVSDSFNRRIQIFQYLKGE